MKSLQRLWVQFVYGKPSAANTRGCQILVTATVALRQCLIANAMPMPR
jgi:hypothetical protein